MSNWLTPHCELCRNVYRKNILKNFMIFRLIDVENINLKIKIKLKNIVVIIGKKQMNMSKTTKNQFYTSEKLVIYDEEHHQHSNRRMLGS